MPLRQLDPIFRGHGAESTGVEHDLLRDYAKLKPPFLSNERLLALQQPKLPPGSKTDC